MDKSIRSFIDNLNQKEAMLLLIAAMDRINQTIINMYFVLFFVFTCAIMV